MSQKVRIFDELIRGKKEFVAGGWSFDSRRVVADSKVDGALVAADCPAPNLPDYLRFSLVHLANSLTVFRNALTQPRETVRF